MGWEESACLWSCESVWDSPFISKVSTSYQVRSYDGFLCFVTAFRSCLRRFYEGTDLHMGRRRYFYKDKAARRAAFERVRAAYRLPNTVFSYFSQTPSKSQPSVGALRGLDITPIGGPTFASSHLMVGSGITQRAKVKLRNGAQSAVRALLPAFPYLSGHGSLLLRTAGLFPSRPGLSALQAVK